MGGTAAEFLAGNMSFQKSERHQKIIGQFGELLVCNRLSCSGFEDVMLVDHVGIDVIAYHKDFGHLGISVKSRARNRKGSEEESVNLFASDDDKLERICNRLKLIPWIAVYAETKNGGDLYLTSLKNYRTFQAGNLTPTKICVWNMRKKHKDAYALDNGVMHFHVDFAEKNWFGKVNKKSSCDSLPEGNSQG